MKKFAIIFIGLIMLSNCSIPQKMHQGKAVNTEIIGNESSEQKILLGSTDSEFKQALINEIKEYAMQEKKYMKITGIENLKKENIEQYSKVIIINTCLAWGMEYNVQDFLKNCDELDKVIVVTTSGDGGWLPKNYTDKIDAIATASVMVDAEKIKNKIVKLIENE